MQAFSLARPADASAAITQAAQPGAKFIAGGTDLMQLMKARVEAPTTLVDVDHLPFAGIAVDGDGLRIGALARMSDVAADARVVAQYPVISQALLSAASPQVRNMASIGGNLLQRTRCGYFRDTGFSACNKRSPGSGCAAIGGENRMLAILGGSDHCIATHPSDLPVALVALDAVVELQGPQGNRAVRLADFHLLPGDTPQHETVLRPGELIVAITVPASPWAQRSAYLKLRDRASFEFALVSVAVALEVSGGLVREARVALGGVGAKPWRAPGVEAALRGQPATPEAFERAAARATEGARPASGNGFKVVLAQRAVARALASVA
jgi:xanthine dehydrogenase YagS FAD-binding subunit